MKLNEKYELIKKINSDKKNLYQGKDNFNNMEVFIEPYIEINSSDWTKGGKINEELRKLKLSQLIDDYFYTDNKDKSTKIFYKVYFNNPLEKKVNNTSKNKQVKNNSLYEETTSIDSADNLSEEGQVVTPANIERVMVCENCETEINLRNFNNSTNTAYCNVCHKEHKIIFKKKRNKKLRAKKSRFVNIKKTKNKLLIEVSKGKTEIIFTAFITLIWAIFRLSQTEFIWGILETCLYSGVIFILFLMSFDKKYIEVTKGVLKSYSKPISLNATKNFKVSEIEQLYVKKGITEGARIKTLSRARRRNEDIYVDAQLDVYYLIVILKNGKGEFSIFETHNSEDALLLERTIENFLKIKDVRVNKEINLS